MLCDQPRSIVHGFIKMVMVDTDDEKRFRIDAFLDDMDVIEKDGQLIRKARVRPDESTLKEFGLEGIDVSQLPDWVTVDFEMPKETSLSVGDEYH